MTIVAPPPPRHDHTNEAQLLFKEAKQRRRRLRVIWVVGVVAIAVVGCAVGFAFGFQDSSPPATEPHSPGAQALPGHLRTGVTLVYAFDDLRIINADTGSSRTLPMPAPYGSSRDLGMVRVGSSLLLNRGNTAWLYSSGISGAPTELGRSDGVFRGPNRGEAWIWSQPCLPPYGCSNYNAVQMGSLQLIDSSGTGIGSPVQLPGGAGWYPTGQANDAGIILSSQPAYGNREELWVPLTNRVVRVFSNASVIGAAGNLVVSDSGRYCSIGCSVQVTDVKTGTEKSVLLPRGLDVTGDAAISPSGETIALTAALRRPARTPYPEAIALVDVRSGTATLLPGSQQTTNPNWGPMSLTWSTNGWLFADTVGSSVVHVWQPGESRAWVLPKVALPRVQLVNEDPSLIAL